MKKLFKSSFSIFLAITIIFSSAYVGLGELDFSGLFAVNAEAASIGDLTFKLNSDGESYSVTNCDTAAEGEIVIPDTYNDLPVTHIGNYAFKYCSSLTTLAIGDNVTSIGDCAFYACTSLTDVMIPDSVTSISESAFSNTRYYNDSSNWENDVLYIGNHLIKAKTSLSGKYTIKEGTKTIVEDAFEECTSLTSVIIPDSVTSVGISAFYSCSSLTSVIIGDSVTNIGNYAFKYCSSLTTLTIGDSVTSIGDDAFHGCEKLVSVTIPDSVTSIGISAFYSCSSLTSVIIGDSVTSIGNSAFENCYGLTSVAMGDSVTSIGARAFDDCKNLTSITIPDSVTSIGYEAFYNCYDLTAVYITDIVAWCDIDFYGYESNPLYYAKKLYINGELATDVVIPDGVTGIGDYAFRGCTNLTSITIPDSVTSIGYCAFHYCYSLTSIIIPDSVTSIGGFAFDDTSYYNDSSNWDNDVLYIGNHLIKASASLSGEYTIKEGTKTIAEYAFEECTSLTSLIIPGSLTSIGDSAFYYHESLTSVTIGDGVTSIGDSAFYNCTSLTSVTIGDSVTSIGDSAFKYCYGLTSVAIGDGVTSIGDYAFSGCKNLTSITIPDSLAYIGCNVFDDAPVIICCYPNSIVVEYCEYNNYEYKYITFCVEYNYNYEGATTKYQYKDFNEPISLISTIPTRSGYEFLGWSTTKNGVVEFMPGQTYSENVDIVLYAVWREYEHYVITYNANGGVSAPPEQEKVEFKNIILSNNIPEKLPFVFEGWSTTQNGEVQYMSGDVYSKDQSITLYAVWRLQCDDCDSTGKTSKKCQKCSGDGIVQDSCTKCNGKGGKTIEPCSACGGDGGYKRVTCSLCGGDGVAVLDTEKCPVCEGKGYTPYKPNNYDCPKCNGSGKNMTGGACSWCYGTGEYHVTCYHCKGEGEVYREGECYRCDGSGEYTRHCSTCGGDGKEWQDCLSCVDGDVDCSSCNKTGWEYKDKTCSKCNGSGELPDNYVGVIKHDGQTYYIKNGLAIVCEHTSTKWITDKEATVYKAGSKHKECTECGEILKTATIPQLKCSKPVLKKVYNANSYVKVTWDTVKGADLYRVYRMVSGGEYEYIGSTKNKYFNDKNAPAGKTCRYRIRAKNEAGYSEYSASIAIKHIDEPVLKTITNTTSGVKITWGKVTGAQKYSVYRKVSGGEHEYIGATTNAYYTDETAKSGTKYYYAIRGKRDDSVSSQSSSLSKYHLADPTLNTPTTTSKGVGLRWSEVAGAEGYMVYRRTASGSYKRITTEEGVDNVTYRDTTAKKGTKYYYKVKAYYSKTYSAYSNTKAITDKY